MKYAAMIAVVLMVAGCGAVDRLAASATGYSTVCVEGVKYIQFTSGASVMYDRTGKVVLCN